MLKYGVLTSKESSREGKPLAGSADYTSQLSDLY
jgi:hypothetical protein